MCYNASCNFISSSLRTNMLCSNRVFSAVIYKGNIYFVNQLKIINIYEHLQTNLHHTGVVLTTNFFICENQIVDFFYKIIFQSLLLWFYRVWIPFAFSKLKIINIDLIILSKQIMFRLDKIIGLNYDSTKLYLTEMSDKLKIQ